MGLDQYLYARRTWTGTNMGVSWSDPERVASIVAQAGGMKLEPNSPFAGIQMTVAYWRKENAIHQWFVDNCQDGEDNCAEYYVSHEKMKELVELCKEVLSKRGDSSVAEEMLPTANGFFFGSTDYDDWYYEGLAYTIETFEALIGNPEYEEWSFHYQSSW